MTPELLEAIENMERALSDVLATFRQDNGTTVITGERGEAWEAALADFRKYKLSLQNPYLTRDQQAVFESPLAAAQHFEDRFEEIRKNYLGLQAARQHQDTEGFKFFLTQLALLCQPLVGVQNYTRKPPDEDEDSKQKI